MRQSDQCGVDGPVHRSARQGQERFAAHRIRPALVQAGQDQLRDQGVAQLTGFLTPAAVGQMVALASQLAAQAWASDQAHTVYFEPVDDSAGPDHPRALLQHSAKQAIAYDQIPADAAIRRLYESDDLTVFIAAVLGKRVLCRSADPLDALEIAIFGDGDELGWHFDNSEFSVTVMYQQAEVGGHFDYRGDDPVSRWQQAGLGEVEAVTTRLR